VDFSDLHESSRSLVAAAEIEADSIFAKSRRAADQLEAEAYHQGVDPSGIGYSPGDIALDLARKQRTEGQNDAAGHLFGVTAGEYMKREPLDTEGFNAKLETIGDWVSRKYQPSRSMLDDLKRHFRALALRKRAAALQVAEFGDNRPKVISEGDLADLPELSPSARRRLAIHWDTLLDHHRLNEAAVDWYASRPDHVHERALAKVPDGRAPWWVLQWLQERERTRKDSGISASVAVAKGRFTALASAYRPLWESSGAEYGAYSGQLKTIEKQVLGDLESIWKGHSRAADQWFETAIAPAVGQALAILVREQISQARDLELQWLVRDAGNQDVKRVAQVAHVTSSHGGNEDAMAEARRAGAASEEPADPKVLLGLSRPRCPQM
jgi:hypothetical protein